MDFKKKTLKKYLNLVLKKITKIITNRKFNLIILDVQYAALIILKEKKLDNYNATTTIIQNALKNGYMRIRSAQFVNLKLNYEIELLILLHY